MYVMIGSRGVYRILCTKNNMSYVGYTINSFSKRWKEHIKGLTSGVHHCSLLQNDWIKYGANEFVFKILNIEDDRSKCLELEQSYINGMKEALYNTSLNNGLAKDIYVRRFDNTKIEIASSMPTVIRKRNGKNFFVTKKEKNKYSSNESCDVWKWNGKSFSMISTSDVIFTKNNFDEIELLYDFDTGFFDTKTKEEKLSLNLGLSTDFAGIGELAILRPTNRHEVHSIFRIKDKGNGRFLLSNGRWVLSDMIVSIDCTYDSDFWP